MTSKCNGQKNIYPNRLYPSHSETINGCILVDGDYRKLCRTYMIVKGIELFPPKSLMPDITRWREMIVRYNRSDWRNSEAEVMSLRAVAQWLVDINCELRNQPPKKIEWGD